VFYQHFRYRECLFISNSDSSDEFGIRVNSGESGYWAEKDHKGLWPTADSALPISWGEKKPVAALGFDEKPHIYHNN